ncbi:MAG TPA: hypothetical protein EYG73_00260 [Arcobacter sp.]|nr:hypothetical protein [Arcobacter sp.]
MIENQYITSYYLSIDENDNFIDLDTSIKMTSLVESYSLAKYGSMKDIQNISKIIIKSIFTEIDDLGSELRKILEKAKKNNDFIVLMTPGYRNVKSSANIMFETVLPIVNTKLSILGLPIIAEMKLPRLASPTENYASLSQKEREIVGLTTDHILPDVNFYQNDIHVLYGDDVLITGSSSNKARLDTLSKGAKSFLSIYSIVIDSNITTVNPSIEEFLNTSKVTGKLDSSAEEIFIQDNFEPVLRSLRLILNRENSKDLKVFMKKIPIENILKIYIAYITNESIINEKYFKSLEIIKKYLVEHNKIYSDGNLIYDNY